MSDAAENDSPEEVDETFKEAIKCYLTETRHLINDIKKEPENYRPILRTLSMTKDNSKIIGFIPIYKLYKALEDLYKSLCDDKIIFSENLHTLINLVADKILDCCMLIEADNFDMDEIDVKPYLLYCDKAVAGEIFNSNHLLKRRESKSRIERKINQVQNKLPEQKKDEILKISSDSIAKIINMHEEMIARTYIISNQVALLKTAIADNEMRSLKETYKLLANDSQNLQNSLLIAHENLLALIQDDIFLKNHQDLQGFFVTANDEKFLIPSEFIFDVICESPMNYEIQQNQKILKYVLESETGEDEDAEVEHIPVYSLSSLLPGQKAKAHNILDTILIVDYQSQRIGIIVDTVQKFVSVIKKNMPPAFRKFHAVTGVAFDEKYDMIPVLHIPEIMRRFRSLRGYDVKKFEAITKKHVNKILIVDDSETTRQIERTIVLSNNYTFEEACDGIEALELIKEKHFDLIICDDDMPRMNGEILLDNIRRLENYKNVPVVAISERPLQKADAFVCKSDFNRNTLVKILKRMLDNE